MYTVKRMGEITIDGMVNEAAWMVTDSITEFYQTQPNPGYTATERTVVRILYDKIICMFLQSYTTLSQRKSLLKV